MSPLFPLEAIGWTAERQEAWDSAGRPPNRVPARVVQTDRGEATVWTSLGVELRTRMTKAARLVVAGDWVAVDLDADRIVEILPRSSAFERRAARGARSGQVLAANMDVVAVMQSADNVNPRRLERELVLAHESGARPVVIVSKLDTVDDSTAAAALSSAAAVSPGVAVVGWGAPAGLGREALEAAIPPGVTFALLGASGVGKSTLVNRFSTDHVQLTAETRAGDGKGRHTTTAARLIPLGDGRLVIDTPGVRAMGLWRAEAGLELAFPEITDAAAGCRFDNCVHDHEPGCAVRELVARGELDPERFANWHRLREELDSPD